MVGGLGGHTETDILGRPAGTKCTNQWTVLAVVGGLGGCTETDILGRPAGNKMYKSMDGTIPGSLKLDSWCPCL